jgi:hypothetical protein
MSVVATFATFATSQQSDATVTGAMGSVSGYIVTAITRDRCGTVAAGSKQRQN